MAVQIVEKWQADDGRIFDTELEAIHHEKYIEIGSVFVENESTMIDLVRFYDFTIELQKYFTITRISEV